MTDTTGGFFWTHQILTRTFNLLRNITSSLESNQRSWGDVMEKYIEGGKKTGDEKWKYNNTGTHLCVLHQTSVCTHTHVVSLQMNVKLMNKIVQHVLERHSSYNRVMQRNTLRFNEGHFICIEKYFINHIVCIIYYKLKYEWKCTFLCSISTWQCECIQIICT